ncbi:MAG: hypothetical protein OEN20_03430 [Gammaproteobacteria bacterium]|nr:hypothetical protein [Gammaproteobacteria bacterium]
MRASKTVFQAGALLLVLAMLCACGKKGRLYIPPAQESAVDAGAARLAMPLRE